MYCPKCGVLLSTDASVYYSCGHLVRQPQDNKGKRKTRRYLIMGFFLLGISLILSSIINFDISYFFYDVDYKSQNTYYNDNNGYIDNEIVFDQTREIPTTTVITTSNRFDGVNVRSAKEAIELIREDSYRQKSICPKDIVQLEEKITRDYGIPAVNLCEMAPDLAQGVYDVIGKIYHDYPDSKGYLTNLSVLNLNSPTDYIAAFMATYPFINYSSLNNPKKGYPTVFKTQMLLNTYYYFDVNRMQIAMINSSNSGHFPPNATIYSPIAHELGHYLSFIALLKSYQTDSILLVDKSNLDVFSKIFNDFKNSIYSRIILEEAYSRDVSKGALTFDAWRGTISRYALARGQNGMYIYDETVAEAFHDYFLNGDSAKNASKVIVEVLKEKLNK